jgi:acetyl-CoA synthetase
LVYGPLANGVATTVFESTPVYPTPARFWETIDKHKLTHFYTAPTAVRLLRRLGESWVKNADLSTLRIIGSVGEPINPEAWHWLNDHVGRKQAAIVDTFFQTETGSIVVSPLPGAIECKPGSATVPFLGIEAALLDPVTGKVGSLESSLGGTSHKDCYRNLKEITLKAFWCSKIPGLLLPVLSGRIITGGSMCICG